MGRQTSLTADQVKEIHRWREKGTLFKVIAHTVGCTIEQARYQWDIHITPRTRSKRVSRMTVDESTRRLSMLSAMLRAEIVAAQAESGGVLRPYR
jgi:hypothetical protein